MLDEIEGVETITPRGPAMRGAMFNLRVSHRSRAVQERLAARGVVLDFREPDIFRMALAPLYSTYKDAWRFAAILREVVAEVAS